VRDVEKAKNVFAEEFRAIDFIQMQLSDISRKTISAPVDFIIHLASPTAGKYMEEHPVETFNLAYQSTLTLLNFSKQTNVAGMVYVSSLEYYGQVLDDRVITEDMQGYVDPVSARSSYPMGKRAAEYLCFAYALEYGTSAKVARLTQTLGAGISEHDKRVFAQFARSVINGEDIVLHTTGESAKPYCYTTDCISAILYILLRGQRGEAYNVANPKTYISIRDLAEFLKRHFNPAISIHLELHEDMGYAPVTKLKLSAEKLYTLGWNPEYGLKGIFERLIKYMS
jgi:nucleoside-diphosphate-sugar epimerase